MYFCYQVFEQIGSYCHGLASTCRHPRRWFLMWYDSQNIFNMYINKRFQCYVLFKWLLWMYFKFVFIIFKVYIFLWWSSRQVLDDWTSSNKLLKRCTFHIYQSWNQLCFWNYCSWNLFCIVLNKVDVEVFEMSWALHASWLSNHYQIERRGLLHRTKSTTRPSWPWDM